MLKFISVLILMLVIATFAAPQAPADQYAVMVFDRSNESVCPLTIDFLPTGRLEIPFKSNGELDKAKAKLIGISVNYVTSCGKVEIRRAPGPVAQK